LGEEVAERVAGLADWIELNLPRVMAAREEIEQRPYT
jgi:DNA-binding HxlR family transcriptional regulator